MSIGFMNQLIERQSTSLNNYVGVLLEVIVI